MTLKDLVFLAAIEQMKREQQAQLVTALGKAA